MGLRAPGMPKAQSRKQHLATAGTVEQLRCDRAAGRDRVGAALVAPEHDPSVQRREEAFDLDARRIVIVHSCECAGRKVAITTELFEERSLRVDRSPAGPMLDA